MANQEASNGSAPKEKTLLDKLHDQWKAAGGNPAPDAVNKKLVENYKKTTKAKEEAEQALKKAAKAQSDAAAAIIVNNGKKHFKIGGKTHIPMSRGDTVFFRGEGSGEVQDLG
jgi:hypothetical protein